MTFCYTDLLWYATVSAWHTHVKLLFLLTEKHNGHSQIFLRDVKFDLYSKHTQKVLPATSNLVFTPSHPLQSHQGISSSHKQVTTNYNYWTLMSCQPHRVTSGQLNPVISKCTSSCLRLSQNKQKRWKKRWVLRVSLCQGGLSSGWLLDQMKPIMVPCIWWQTVKPCTNARPPQFCTETSAIPL